MGEQFLYIGAGTSLSLEKTASVLAAICSDVGVLL